MSDTTETKCASCGSFAVLQCSRCKKVHYCSVDHQKNHWKLHKSLCKGFYEVQSNERLGRHLVASCNIPAHTEIFNEVPLILGPKFFPGLEDTNETPVKCVGCFKTIEGTAFSCPRCQWPACSPDCKGLNMAKFHGLECSVLALGTRIHFNEAMNNPSFFRLDSLLPLKCFLMQIKCPQKYADLMLMESHMDEIKQTELHKEFQTRVLKYLEENFLDCLKKCDAQSANKMFANLETEETIMKICGILETNAMSIRLDNKDELNGIYKVGSLLEHSCLPNCYFSFDVQNNFKLKVMAGRDIRQGEHISISYTNSLWGTQQRQEHLLLTKCFTCKCERCTDPTEMSTHFSSLKCLGASVSCAGFQLPVNPIDRDTEWICTENDCVVRLNNHQVFEFMQNVESEVENVLADDKTTICQLETAIEKLGRFLHPNHYHNFALKHSLVQLYGFQPGYEYFQLPMEKLDEKVRLCQELLGIVKSLDPHFLRLSLYAGTLAFEMYRTLCELNRRGIDRHFLVGLVRDSMDEMIVFGKLTLAKDSDVPEAKQLLERFNNL